MAEINNVDLVFLRRVRGVSPLSRYAANDDGSVTVSVPDEMEVRTFHVVRFDNKGKSRVQETYTVETLRKTEIGGGEGTYAYLGTTDDDLYLFRQTRKSRFLPDRRASYTDVSLNQSGGRFVAAFCDMLASGHALALGDMGGRLLWTKDVAFPIARVAVDREGVFIAVAGETGDLHLLDNTRATLLRHRQETAISAVATLGPALTAFAGGGGVGAIDSEGRLLWFTPVVGEPLEVAVAATGGKTDETHGPIVTAALLRLDDTSGRLVFFNETGLPTWDIDFDESRPTGLSLSANGRFVAVTLRDGSLSVYELHYGERLASLTAEQTLAEAHAARSGGNLRAALDILRGRLASVPSDTVACDALADTLTEMRERAFATADNALAVGDWREADTRLAELLAEVPFDPDAAARRAHVRAGWTQAALDKGNAALQSGEGGDAEAHFLEAIEANPLNHDARAALARARTHAAETTLALSREQVGRGDWTAAIASLADAQSRGASGPEVSGLLRSARVGEALALGNALYADRQYAAALFQFKKVLRLDPDNAEARQKTAYAQNFLQDTQLNDRFTRLE